METNVFPFSMNKKQNGHVKQISMYCIANELAKVAKLVNLVT